jgi:hypothetical protein
MAMTPLKRLVEGRTIRSVAADDNELLSRAAPRADDKMMFTLMG